MSSANFFEGFYVKKKQFSINFVEKYVLLRKVAGGIDVLSSCLIKVENIYRK